MLKIMYKNSRLAELARAIFAVIGLSMLVSLLSAVDVICSPGRFSSEKRTSIGFYLGRAQVSGELGAYGAAVFNSPVRANSLFDTWHTFGIEYTEIIGRSSLSSGVRITRANPTDAVRSLWGIPNTGKVSVTYVDIPITWRIGAYSPGKHWWNISGGFSAPIMIDILNTDGTVFEATADGSTEGNGTDKHVDLALGFGVEMDIERHLLKKTYMYAQIGVLTVLSGSNRPDNGYLNAGVRVYEF